MQFLYLHVWSCMDVEKKMANFIAEDIFLVLSLCFHKMHKKEQTHGTFMDMQNRTREREGEREREEKKKLVVTFGACKNLIMS